MFEVKKKISFRDQKNKAKFGTILKVVEENSATVTLEVIEDFTKEIHLVKKIRPEDENMAEKFYQEHGHY